MTSLNQPLFGGNRELSREECAALSRPPFVLIPTRNSELAIEDVTLLTQIAREETHNQEWFREVMKERMWKPR